MIGYVTIGSNDIVKAAEYYDQLLAEIGASRMMEEERVPSEKFNFGMPTYSGE